MRRLTGYPPLHHRSYACERCGCDVCICAETPKQSLALRVGLVILALALAGWLL